VLAPAVVAPTAGCVEAGGVDDGVAATAGLSAASSDAEPRWDICDHAIAITAAAASTPPPA
jgi:hypothetical protein